MSESTGDQGGAFARAFLPGLVLGLVIGGVCGAILPTLLESRPKIEHTGTSGASGARERDGERVEDTLDDAAIQEAIEAAEREGGELIDEAGQALEEGGDALEDAADNLTPPSDD